MAIDSAPKRKAIAHLARPWSGKGVTPDVSKPKFWRQVVGWGYGGIAVGAAAVVAAGDELIYYIVNHWHQR